MAIETNFKHFMMHNYCLEMQHNKSCATTKTLKFKYFDLQL